MTAQQQGGSSSFTRWLPANERGGNAYLSVFSTQISSRNELNRQYHVTAYCMSVF